MISNINTLALDEMSDAVAHAILTYAMSTSAVSGTAKGSPTPPRTPVSVWVRTSDADHVRPIGLPRHHVREADRSAALPSALLSNANELS